MRPHDADVLVPVSVANDDTTDADADEVAAWLRASSRGSWWKIGALALLVGVAIGVIASRGHRATQLRSLAVVVAPRIAVHVVAQEAVVEPPLPGVAETLVSPFVLAP